MKKFFVIFAIIVSLIGIVGVYSAVTNFFDTQAWYSLWDGNFYANGSGNAWTANMTPSGIDNSLIIGNVDFQAFGVATFENAYIIPPNAANPTRHCWTLGGKIFSKNIGHIDLSGANTHIRYNPLTRQLEWYGYNRNIGKAWLGMDDYCQRENDELTDEILTAIKNDGKLHNDDAGFIGRVKVIGNIGNTRTIFDRVYDMEKWISTTNYTSVLSEVRKNVALLSRNLPDIKKNSNFHFINPEKLDNKIFFINEQSNNKTVEINHIPDGIRSIIVIGGDVVITSNLQNISKNSPRAIIVLKNIHGQGGNLYIKENVTNIDASIFTEKSLLSGEGEHAIDSQKRLYNDTAEELAKLPKNQLYIRGSLFSLNTIGGASKDSKNPQCPYYIDCTGENAPRYDLNYMRSFDPRDIVTGRAKRAYRDHSLDKFSVIIEYDYGIIVNPPPWFEIIE